MKTAISVLMTLAVLSQECSAQVDWRALLQKDLVTIQGDRMVLDRITLDRIEFPGAAPVQFQVKYRAEAPVRGLMSRDNLVAFSAATASVLIFGIYAESYGVPMSEFLEAYDSQDLDAPIGTPDLEVNLVMTTAGVQFEVLNTATGQRVRNTQTWEQIFGGAG